jgi:adenylate cyclase
LLASALGHLGDIDEAQRIWSELKQVNPRYSFAEHLSRLPFSNPAHANRIKDELAKARLPTEHEYLSEPAPPASGRED